jgi:hypothetical protein
LQRELVVPQDVHGVAEDFVQGAGRGHLIQRLSNGNGTNTTSRLRDGDEGAGEEELAALLVQGAVADELDEVGKPAETVGVFEQREAVVAREACSSRSGARGDVLLPELDKGGVGDDRSPGRVGREWWYLAGFGGMEEAEGRNRGFVWGS